MTIFSKAFRNRVADFTLTLTDVDGVTQSVISAGDVVRVKIGRTGVAPILDLDSAAASANGSTVSEINPIDIHIDPADTALLAPGNYDIEIAIVDQSIGNKLINVETGAFLVLDSPTGSVGAI